MFMGVVVNGMIASMVYLENAFQFLIFARVFASLLVSRKTDSRASSYAYSCIARSSFDSISTALPSFISTPSSTVYPFSLSCVANSDLNLVFVNARSSTSRSLLFLFAIQSMPLPRVLLKNLLRVFWNTLLVGLDPFAFHLPASFDFSLSAT